MTPPWVLVLVGVLGIVGAWGAQLIAARNERRRRADERGHEAAAHWRDKRLEAYTDFLRAVQAGLGSAKREYGIATGRSEMPSLSEAIDRAVDAYAPIELIGTERTIRLALDALVQLLLAGLIDPADMHGTNSTDEQEKTKADVAAVEASVHRLLAHLRTELALALPAEVEQQRRWVLGPRDRAKPAE